MDYEKKSLLQSKSHYGSTEDAMVAQTPLPTILKRGLDDGSVKIHSSHGHGHSHDSHGHGHSHDSHSHDSHSHDSAISSGEHCHKYRGDLVDKKARRKLILASILCLLFMTGEIIGGWWSNSLAIATDAAHLLTDFASFMISLFSLYVSARPATRRMSFGWYRAEVLGALSSVLLIWVVTAVLVYLAVLRIITDEYEIDATVMLITSSIGVVVNIVMGLTLHQHGHSHGGGSSHSHGGSSHSHQNQSEDNINVRAAFIHVVGDFIQSCGVCAAAFVIYFKPEWRIVDPICTFLFSILVLMTTFAILKDTLQVLMEATPKGMEFQEVLDTLQKTQGVLRVHNVRIWALSMDKIALCAHIVINQGEHSEKILRSAEAAIRSRYKIFELTLQVEPFVDSMNHCEQCVSP